MLSPSGRRNGDRDTREDNTTMQSASDKTHWRRTTRLMFAHLAVWLFFGYIIHMFVNTLNQSRLPILNFPLGFYMAAQGSLIVFVVTKASD